jgi:hypothetical protein
MKYLKTYNKLFESGDFSWFRDLFLELKHDGFNVSVKESTTQKMDFSRLDSFGSWDLQTKNYNIKTIDVKVDKRIIDEDGQSTLRPFNIDEIKETLLFAESYAKGELGLELVYVYVVKIPSYTYYKSVDVLPDNQMVNSVTFAFRKID